MATIIRDVDGKRFASILERSAKGKVIPVVTTEVSTTDKKEMHAQLVELIDSRKSGPSRTWPGWKLKENQ